MSLQKGFPILDLYIGPHCPLCHQAEAVLALIEETYGLPFRIIDIYGDDRLLEKYQLMIPVAAFEGACLGYGRIYYSELADRLEEINLIKND